MWDANKENRYNDVNEDDVQMKYYEILQELNSVNRVEIECHLQPQEHPQLIHGYCTKIADRLEGSSPHDVPLRHAHNLKPPYTLNYHELEDSQHAKIIAT